MTSLRIALTELRRITGGRMPLIATIAMVLVPTLYGGFYLYANNDPYSRLKNVPAALVVADRGAEDVDGKPVRAGADVADELISSNSFDWRMVSAGEARDGVRDGTYDFALTIPRDFSAALTSSARFEPRQARIEMTTNDANSYLSTTIANTVTGNVRDALATRVSREAAANFLLGIAQIRGSLVEAADGADRLAAAAGKAQRGAGRIAAGARGLEQGAGRLQDGAGALASGLRTLQERTAQLPGQARALAKGSRQVADGDAKISAVGRRAARLSAGVVDSYAGARSRLAALMDAQQLTAGQQRQLLALFDRAGTPIRDANTEIQRTAQQLDRLAVGADRVADGNALLARSSPALVDGIVRAADGAAQLGSGGTRLADGSAQLADGASRLDTGLGRLRDGAAELRDGLRSGVSQIPATDARTRARVAKTIGDPVRVGSLSQASAGSYGAGLAPFFLSLAAWIGGYVMFLLIRPLSKRAMSANQTPLRVAFGGWLAPALLGAVQMAVLFTVVVVGLRIVPSHLPGTLAFLVLVSATFVAIVHALNAWFGAPGQFLGLVLMVLQLVTAGGTFPWQTIPGPLYPLHYVLPMSYSVQGLRQMMYGGLDAIVLRDVAVLVAYLLVALALSSVAARRQRVWTPERIKPELVL